MSQRACETVQVTSLHSAFAPIGAKRWVTPEEAKLMLMIGRAELANAEQPSYPTRHMVATTPKKVKGR
jgi:hypothetical protein